MDRRELLHTIAALTGSAFVGADRATAFVYVHAPDEDEAYGPGPIALLDEIAETILPRTDTPGAKDAQVGRFIARHAVACYDEAKLAILRAGLADVDRRSRKETGRDFTSAGAEQRQTLLMRIDAEAKRHSKDQPDRPPHWFTLFKQLTLFGFFTSEAGATQVLRYRPIPGPYKGVVPYKQGETFWS